MADSVLFKQMFPEFAATSATVIDFWFAQGALVLTDPALSVQIDLASMLYVAHNLVLGMAPVNAAASGNVPGSPPGPIASKGAGGLSVSYDTALTATTGAGVFNATVYGQRLWKMFEAAAMGGRYRAPPPRRHVFGSRVLR